MNELKQLKVGRKPYKIRHKFLPADYGTISFKKRLIHVDDPQHPLAEVDTLLHEILHAIWKNKGFKTRVREEIAVTKIAHGLTAVFQDNPGFLIHLEKLLKDSR